MGPSFQSGQRQHSDLRASTKKTDELQETLEHFSSPSTFDNIIDYDKLISFTNNPPISKEFL